jgi:signal transduction histidine kinase
MYSILNAARIPFDFVHEEDLGEERLAQYSVLILPNVALLSDRQATQIEDYVQRGGSLLATFETDLIENIRAGRRIEYFETVRRTKSGQLLDVSLTVSPIKDDHGRIIGASKILRDVSTRKRLEQSLMQAEKIAATGRMAATIAHEINNPLEAVMNLLYLLRPMIADPAGITYFQSIETELGRVSHIAKQTLGYYREHASASSASLAEVVLHAITIYEPRCTATGIEITKALNSSRKTVLCRGEMMQVVSNLIMNSVYAMQAGGVLSVSVEDAVGFPDGIVLTI